MGHESLPSLPREALIHMFSDADRHFIDTAHKHAEEHGYLHFGDALFKVSKDEVEDAVRARQRARDKDLSDPQARREYEAAKQRAQELQKQGKS